MANPMDNTPAPQPAKGALPEGRFSGPNEFADLIRQSLICAAKEGWREMVWCDSTFADWPLGERGVTDCLSQWSRSGRKLTVLAGNYKEIVRKHSRFVTWRQRWAHIVDCRANSAVAESDLPSALWSPVWVFQRVDIARSTGFSGRGADRRVALKERLDACLKLSSPAFAPTTLGL